MKKFELTEKTKTHFDRTLYQIKALKDFGDVEKGELGGWIEKESNLSQEGDAWVYYNARVFGDARVFDNASVFGKTWVYGNTWVFGNAWVFGDVRVFGDAWVFGDVRVSGKTWVFGNARVSGKLKLESGWCFGSKRANWNVTELENEDEILLIKDYKPAVNDEDNVEVNVEGNIKVISRKSAIALGLLEK